MSWLSGLINALLSCAKTAGTIAADAGVATATVNGTKISITALVTQLDTLAKADPGGALVTSLNFNSLKTFLLSQQFESDLVDIADLLGIIGLAVPPVAVAANDLRTFAMILTVMHSLASGLIALGLFSKPLIPDGQGGFVTQAWADEEDHQLNADGSFKT